MKQVEIEIEGITPLLQHRMTQEELFGLLGAKTERKKAKEVLTPREIAEKYVYKSESGECYIPMDYVVGAFAHVASDYKQKNTARKSLKTVARGIFRPSQESATLLDKDNKPLKDFEVDVRKATNHQKGAVAVCRPRFDTWKTKFKVMIDDDIVATETAHEILNDAGKRSGIGSFRVSKGGYFGQFIVTKWTEL